MMKKSLINYQFFLFFGFVSVVASDDNLILCAVDRDLSPNSPFMKDKYSEFINFLSGHGNPSDVDFQTKSYQNGEAKENSSSLRVKGAKEMNQKKSAEVPLQRNERFYNDKQAMFARPNTMLDGFKRGPGFRSWGGKRARLAENDGDLTKRPRFSSWGGKRREQFPFNEGLNEQVQYRNCDGKDTCDDIVKRDLENYNFYDRPLTRDPPSRFVISLLRNNHDGKYGEQ
ncbi:hypothetical protein RUM44_000766 [Polyplax serrata]|uniref:Uncharacterized protein n=1 Tax=Polyplax serrata TaxID=468196 RepID=A0ABR1B8K6_POLSC